MFLSLYQQYARPHLEFAVAAWSPWTQANIQCLEMVQQRAVRAITGLRATTYEDKLKELEMPSLQEENGDRHGANLQDRDRSGHSEQ